MSLNVADMVQRGSLRHSECILCGTCADTWPSKTIRYTFSGGD